MVLYLHSKISNSLSCFSFIKKNMKFQQIILSISFLLLLLALLVAESSSFNDRYIISHTSVSNKMKDSSISLKNTSLVGNIIRRGSSAISVVENICSSYWPTSSGNFGFGFFKLPCSCSSQDCPDQFVLGISFFNPPVATLVWSTNRYYYKPSLVRLTNDGKFVLRTKPDDKEEPLIPNIQEPVAFAMLHENGNLVFYGSEGEIVWQSFDHPTTAILGGQKLRSGVDLISGESRLSVQDTDGSVAIHAQSSESVRVSVISDALLEGSLSRPIFLSLSTTGDLYLVGSDGIILKYLYRNKNKQQRQQEGASIVKEDDYLYIAKLSSEGHFVLYKERIGGNMSEESSIAVQLWPIYQKSTLMICLTAMKHFFFFVGLYVLLRKLFSVAKAAAWKRMNRSPAAKSV